MKKINPMLLGWMAFLVACVIVAVVFTQCVGPSKPDASPVGNTVSMPSVPSAPSSDEPSYSKPPQSTANRVESLEQYAKDRNLPLSEWTPGLAALFEKLPEARGYVCDYPVKKQFEYEIDLSEYENCDQMPLFIQWDERWGYTEYAGNLLGLSGCGPTSLSMVCVYLLKDSKYSPAYVAEFSERNNYCTKGNGSNWTLFREGAVKLGLKVKELPLSESLVVNNLKKGNPVVCHVGKGHFTSSGHYIVLSGYRDGKIVVNDPNSRERSAQLWDFKTFEKEIRNLWALSV